MKPKIRSYQLKTQRKEYEETFIEDIKLEIKQLLERKR